MSKEKAVEVKRNGQRYSFVELPPAGKDKLTDTGLWKNWEDVKASAKEVEKIEDLDHMGIWTAAYKVDDKFYFVGERKKIKIEVPEEDDVEEESGDSGSCGENCTCGGKELTLETEDQKELICILGRTIKMASKISLKGRKYVEPMVALLTPKGVSTYPITYKTDEEKNQQYEEIKLRGEKEKAFGAIVVSGGRVKQFDVSGSEDESEETEVSVHESEFDEALIVCLMGEKFSRGWVMPYKKEGTEITFGPEFGGVGEGDHLEGPLKGLFDK